MDAEKIRKKNQRDLIITSILVVIFFITFTQNVLLRKKGGPPPTAALPTDNSTQTLSDQMVFVTQMRVYDNLRKERVKLWDKEWGRDPFEPQATAAAIVKAVNLTLKGILWDEKNPKAIVNEKTLVIGDMLYGYTVEKITPKSVILRTGEKTIELQVFRPVFSDTPATN